MKKSLLLLVGKEELLKREHIQNLRRNLFPSGGGESLNFQEFRSEEHSLNDLFGFLQTAPFLAEKRLAVWRSVDDLDAEGKESLLLALGRLPSTAVLVLVSDETSAKKNAFLSKLSQAAEVLACHTPFERDLPSWIDTRLKRKGAQAEKGVLFFLAERFGDDLPALEEALETLVLYVHPRKGVSLDEAKSLFGHSVEGDVFRLVDRILEKNAVAALQILSALFRDGTRAYEILPVLASQMDRLSRAVSFIERKIPAAQIGAELKVHPYYLDKFINQARKVPAESVSAMLERLLSCDEAVKTSAWDERVALEKVVLELSS